MLNNLFTEDGKDNGGQDANMKDLANPKATDNLILDKDASKAAPPGENALFDEIDSAQKPFIKREDVLMTNTELLKDMADVDKRNKEFNDLMGQSAVDSKHLFYKDDADEQYQAQQS